MLQHHSLPLIYMNENTINIQIIFRKLFKKLQPYQYQLSYLKQLSAFVLLVLWGLSWTLHSAQNHGWEAGHWSWIIARRKVVLLQLHLLILLVNFSCLGTDSHSGGAITQAVSHTHRCTHQLLHVPICTNSWIVLLHSENELSPLAKTMSVPWRRVYVVRLWMWEIISYCLK